MGDVREGLRAARAALRSTGRPVRPRSRPDADAEPAPDGGAAARPSEAEVRIATLEAEVARLRRALTRITAEAQSAL